MKKQEERKPYYRSLLLEEFESRKSKNPRYSLRAFSRFLNMDPAALCRIMAEKQDLSPRACASLVRKLKLTSSAKRLFLRSVLEDRKQKEFRRLSKSVGEESKLSPASDLLDRLADTTPMALLQLCDTQGFKPEPPWIARQLGVSESHCRWLIALMIKAGVLAWKDGDLRKTEKTDPRKHLSMIQKAQHIESLRLAIDALERDDCDQHCFSSFSLNIDPSHLPLARALIRQFIEEISDALHHDEGGAAFQLGIQLSPVRD